MATLKKRHQVKKLQFSKSDLYNLKVDDYLKKNALSPIEIQSIQLFKNNAQSNNVSVAAYNKAVENYNAQHGFIMRQQQCNNYSNTVATTYNYINYPLITATGYKTIMDKYRFFVFAYNKSLKEKNNAVMLANCKIREVITKEEKKAVSIFKKVNSKKFTKEYNQLAIKYNQEKVPILKLRRYQTVKYATEIIFDVLIGFYAGQLKKHNAYRMNLGASTMIEKSKPYLLKINHLSVVNHKKNDFKRLDLCKKTVQNHIKRLREAGILTHYRFVTEKKPISVHITPQILETEDGNPPKRQLSENEALTSPNLNVLPNYSDSTRTENLKEGKIKDTANCIVDLAERLCIPAEGLQDHEENRKPLLEKQQKNEEKNKNSHFVASENFRKGLLEPGELAKKLANHDFDKYSSIRKERLVSELQYGNLDGNELKQVLLQDFIKTSAKIWKNHSVYEGEWRKVINQFQKEFLKKVTQRANLIKQVHQLRFRLEFARKWFLKTQKSTKKNTVAALYPAAYFDPTRTDTNEIGFAGTYKIWKTHLKQETAENERVKARIQEANDRKRRLTNHKKLTQAVSQYLQGKKTTEQLFDYVDTNLSPAWLGQIPIIIDKLNNPPEIN